MLAGPAGMAALPAQDTLGLGTVGITDDLDEAVARRNGRPRTRAAEVVSSG
jgi:hypothetical protein